MRLGITIGLMFFFFQAEDGIRDAQESRGLGDVYKRQPLFMEISKTDADKLLRGMDNINQRIGAILAEIQEAETCVAQYNDTQAHLAQAVAPMKELLDSGTN
eukprot:TRINITY_DN57921_c0_g1_i1.p1 TRINITY_DN57921_c0_g1~~TRINITY_DN57921_c0_g1_i1.p1  ORF type:complete len:102 (-),score=31.39 TRINITY_DN57921_c0_g1_i1:711-1016(-)